MQKIVGLKKSNDREIYYFLQNFENLKLGDKVVVQFDEFETIAEVCKLGLNEHDEKAFELPKIKRIATESDISKFNQLQKKAKSKLPEIKKKSLELGLMMKFVSAEFSLDESKVLITFSSEERVDFRQLLKELASMLKARIELRQIGQRDEIKICDGVGPCGEQCCCARFLKNFEHVTVKMAKVQGLSLSPSKINGICGRLMCCLGYESEMYEKMLEKMPKVGSVIKGPNGEGTVVYNDILRERVSIKRQAEGDTFVVEDFSLEEIKSGKVNKSPETFEPKNESKSENKFENLSEKPENKFNKRTENKPEEKPENFGKKHDFEAAKNNKAEKNHSDERKNNTFNQNKPKANQELVEIELGASIPSTKNPLTHEKNATKSFDNGKKHHRFKPKKELKKK